MVGRTEVRKPDDGELDVAAVADETDDAVSGLPSVLLELPVEVRLIEVDEAPVLKGTEEDGTPVLSEIEDEGPVLRGTEVVTAAEDVSPSVTVVVE